MQEFQEKLNNLVRTHAIISNDNYHIRASSNIDTLESEFTSLIAQTLFTIPYNETEIVKKSKQLFLQFHPDKLSTYTPEIRWLESTLSEQSNNGTCFRIITLCKERLLSQQQQENPFETAKNIDDLKSKFQYLKKTSTTRLQSYFYESLIALLDEYTNYDQNFVNIQNNQLKLAIQFLPAILPTALFTVFHMEVIAFYGITALTGMLGYTLQNNKDLPMQDVGKSLAKVSKQSASGVSISLIRIYQFSYWATGRSYNLALDSLKYLPSADPEPIHIFATADLKTVIQPFERYLRLNGQQFFRDIRLGQQKRDKVLQFIANMQILDGKDICVSRKLDLANSYIRVLAENQKINTKGGKLESAILEAQQLLERHNKNNFRSTN